MSNEKEWYKSLEIKVYDKTGELEFDDWNHEEVAKSLEEHIYLIRANGRVIREARRRG